MATLQNRLKQLIRKRIKQTDGMTQADVASEVGIDPATLSRYANGHTGSINIDIWKKAADYFGVPGHEIFDIANEESVV